MTEFDLTIAISDYVRGFVDGRVCASWINTRFLEHDVPEIFARFSAHYEWEVSEFGSGECVAHRSGGDGLNHEQAVVDRRVIRAQHFYPGRGLNRKAEQGTNQRGIGFAS